MVFLIPLLPWAAFGDAPLAARVAAVVAIVVFGVAYVYTVTTMSSWEALPEEASPREQLVPLLPPLAVLAVPMAVSVPMLGWWGIYYAPFVCAIVVYCTRMRLGLGLMTAVGVSALLAVLLSHVSSDHKGMAIGCFCACLVVAVSRVGDEVSVRRRATERELMAAREREEVSRDIHDLLGHSLTVLTLKAEVAQRLIAVDPAAAQAELDEIVTLSRTALADVRATVTRLRTPDLASQVEASRTAFAAAEIEAEVHGRVRDIPLPQREVLSWALREATTNVLRHAGASRVVVTLAPGVLVVADDGVGLGGHAPGNGLTGLRERVQAAGGQLREASPGLPGGRGEGTTLEVRL